MPWLSIEPIDISSPLDDWTRLLTEEAEFYELWWRLEHPLPCSYNSYVPLSITVRSFLSSSSIDDTFDKIVYSDLDLFRLGWNCSTLLRISNIVCAITYELGL